jgi:hypothetical protein
MTAAVARLRRLLELESWRHFRYALFAFLVWRGALFAVGFAGYHLLPHDARNWGHPEPFGEHAYWNGWCRWDGVHYAAIAKRGYQPSGIGPAFFPLYPYGARLLSLATGNVWAALLVSSHVHLLLGLWVFYRLALLKLDEVGARRAIAFLLAFPTSFFFGAAYSESCYFLFTAASFYFFERGKPLGAGAFGFFAALARPTGVLLLPALAAGSLFEVRERRRGEALSMLWLLLIPLGTLSYLGFLQFTVGSPMRTIEAQEAWGRFAAWPWETIVAEAQRVDWTFASRHDGQMVKALNLGCVAFVLASTPAMLRHLGPAHFVFALLTFLVFLSTAWVESAWRVALTVPGVTLATAAWARDRNAERWILFVSSLGLALATARFVNGYWMT